MGRLAHGKAAARPLRLFARRLKIEHIELQKQLALLAKLDVTPPGDRPSPELLTTIGRDFDRPYLALVIKGQQDLISLYERGERRPGRTRQVFLHEVHGSP